MNHLKTTIQPILPGLFLSFGCALFSKLIAHYYLPTLGAATLAILVGIVLGNTFFKSPVLSKGTKFSESKLLELSVILLGLTVTIQTIAQLGVNGLLFVAIQIPITILAAEWLGRRLNFSNRMRLLMGGGNAVCGSSAIASIAPAIGATDKEKGQIITLVNLQGTVMMLSLPFLAQFLWPNQLLSQSALLGGTLQSVGQVVAGASLISQEHIQFAMLYKIIRIMSLVLIVLGFSQLINKSRQSHQTVQTKSGLPWYVTGFIIACLINSFVSFPLFIEQFAHTISTWFELTALAAIGLRLNLIQFLKEGWQFLVYALSIGVVQTLSAVILIYLLIAH